MPLFHFFSRVLPALPEPAHSSRCDCSIHAAAAAAAMLQGQLWDSLPEPGSEPASGEAEEVSSEIPRWMKPAPR